jgi:predicted nucleic acid-binding protein
LSVAQRDITDAVVDASVIAKWYLKDEDLVEEADALLEAFSAGIIELTAPSFAQYEVANALKKAAHEGRIQRDDMGVLMHACGQLALAQASDPAPRVIAAVDLALRFGTSFYDSLYLALAEELGWRLITADAVFYERVAPDMSSVSLLRRSP